ncbi:MAG: GNAT family N-acetyltransferase [Mycobacterium sp.]
MAAGALTVVSPAPREIWEEMAHGDPDAVVTQTPAWLDCVCHDGTFRDASRLYEFTSGRKVVLPLARRSWLPQLLAIEASWPFDWGVGGFITSGGSLSTEEAGAILDDLATRAVLRVSVRIHPPVHPVWTGVSQRGFTTVHHTTHVLDLAGGFDHVWRHKFRSNVRRNVRKAERSSIEVKVDHSGRFIPIFCDLYEQSIIRWAQQQHEPLGVARWRATHANPPHKFATVARVFQTACAVWVASLSGEPVAALIVLRHGDHAKYWRGAMNKDTASPVRANDLLHRLAIEDACTTGCRSYHMGESRPGSSLARFKEGFGATSYSAPTYRHEKLPLTAADALIRGVVKRALGVHDA